MYQCNVTVLVSLWVEVVESGYLGAN